MRLLYFVLDAACLNASVAFKMQNPGWNNFSGSARLDKRRWFLLGISERFEILVENNIQRRASNRNVSGRPHVAIDVADLEMTASLRELEERTMRQWHME
jgi:hypothetical protein